MMNETYDVALANRAISRVGGVSIIDFDGASVEARECETHWRGARRAMLRLHPWNFATERAALGLISAVPVFGWAKQFSMPNDFVRLIDVELDGAQVVDVMREDGWALPMQCSAFSVESGKLLCNVVKVHLLYVRDEDNVERWDDLFQDCFVLALALRINEKAGGGSRGNYDRLNDELRQLMPETKRIDGQENPGRISFGGDWELDRGLGSW